MAELTGVALAMGVPPNTLDLLAAGQVPDSVAARLKVRTDLLQSFVDGQANAGVALLLQSNLETVQALRDTLGREGAIGLLIGLLVRRRYPAQEQE